MATLVSYVPTLLSDIDFNWYEREYLDSYVGNNVYTNFNGIVYEDVVELYAGTLSDEWTLAFGGYNIVADANDNILGGTVTGIIEFDGSGSVTFWLQGISVAATTVQSTYGTLSNSDEVNLIINALSGDDSIYLSEYTDTISGYGGNDSIYGNGGADNLEGASGNDIIDGGSGADTMSGGSGDDQFYVDNALDSVVESSGNGTDKVFAGVAYTLTANVENLTLTGAGAIAGTGNTLANVIIGNDAANAIDGKEGNDTLFGGLGADTLAGGSGDDRIFILAANQTAVEAEFGGTDTVVSAITYTLPAWIENLTLDYNNNALVNGTGNTLDNIIIGNAAANVITGLGGFDKLYGMGGNDTLDGGGDGDWLIGGTGNDTYNINGGVYYVFENAGEGTDRINIDNSLYVPVNIEEVYLQGGANWFVVGNSLGGQTQLLVGNSGANLIIGYDGNDQLYGMLGNDVIYGQNGTDTIYGGDGNDYVAAGTGNDTVNGDNGGDEIYGEAGDDTLIGGSDFFYDRLVGGDGNDTLRGDSGLGDYDDLYGNAGNDIFYVDTPADVVFEQAGEGTDTVRAQIADAGYYLYANIENLELFGSTPFGVGNALNNTLIGSSTSNWLLGGAGNDLIDGGAGNDVLFGEAGADTFRFTAGSGGDLIGDFAVAEDKIDVSALGFGNFAAIQARFVENGSDGAINLGNGAFVVLNGVDMDALTSANFIFG